MGTYKRRRDRLMEGWEAKAKPCSICGVLMQTGGHNSEPVKSGECCDLCNSVVVIPFRFQQLTKYYDYAE